MKMNNSKIVIIGSGFIGSSLAKYLKDYFSVTTISINSQPDWLVFDNKVIFHSKTETSPNTVRMLKKMKLNIDRKKVYSN